MKPAQNPEKNQKIILKEFCPIDERFKIRFNEMSTNNSKILPAVLTKKTEYKKSLEIELTH